MTLIERVKRIEKRLSIISQSINKLLSKEPDNSVISDNSIKVTQANAAEIFSQPIANNLVYFITGNIDLTGLGITTIIVPVGGMHMKGHDYDVSSLECSEDNFTLFSSTGGGSGDIIFSNLSLKTSGNNSQVYDLTSATGFEAVELTMVNYNDCTSLGEINSYRQGLETNTGRFGGTPTLTLSGVWLGGFRISSSVVRSLDAGMTTSIFKAGAGLIFNSRFFTDINCDLPAIAALADFNESNFSDSNEFELINAFISRDGEFDSDDTNIIPNISSSNVKCNWKANIGIDNTFQGGELDNIGEFTTNIVSANTYVDVAANWSSKDLSHFTADVNGQLKYIADTSLDFNIFGDVIVDSTAGNQIGLKIVIFRDKTSSFEDGKIIVREVISLSGPRDIATFNIFDTVKLQKDDYIKLQIANIAATNNITVELNSYIRIAER